MIKKHSGKALLLLNCKTGLKEFLGGIPSSSCKYPFFVFLEYVQIPLFAPLTQRRLCYEFTSPSLREDIIPLQIQLRF